MGKRIAVLGAGANGSGIGAELTRAGEDVVLIDQWPEHVAAMRRHGLRIEMEGETLEVPVRAYNLCDVATFTEPFDIVLLLFKTYDTAWACKLIEPCLAPDGLVAGVQNGMTTDTIASVVGPERTMGCVIEVSAQLFTPGVVQRHTLPKDSWFAVGGIDPATRGREAEVAAVLRHAGRVEIREDIRAAKWMKLVSNATTLGSTALLGLGLDAAVRTPEVREMMVRAGVEALAAGQDQGFAVEPIFGLTPEDMQNTNRLVEMLLDKLGEFFNPETITTVLQDHMKGRKSEVDDINGIVVAEREARGQRAPVNAAIAEINRRIRAGELEPGMDNLELLRAAMAG